MGAFRTIAILVVAGLLLATTQAGQQPSIAAPASGAAIDPQASALIQKTLGVLNGGTVVKDVTLAGTATRTVGPNVDTGSITMKALGTMQSHVEFVSAEGTRTEVRGLDANGVPQGSWAGVDGVTHKVPEHNMRTDAIWFFPSLSVLAQTGVPQMTTTYLGVEPRPDGSTAQHLHFALANPATSPNPNLPPGFTLRIAELSARDVYLDPASFLPVAVKFSTHPDDNELLDVPMEVDFLNYQVVDGVRVPFHIQEFLNGTLLYDVTIQSASMNSGLTAADFTVQ